MQVKDLYYKTEKELELIFNEYTTNDLQNFLNNNDIPFKKNISRKQLYKHTITEILSYGLYYRIGNSK